MDLRRLRHFVMAAEESNFRRAALRLDTNQSIISRHVRDIEEELGADLFLREPGHGARLTEVGRAFLRDVREIFDNLDHAKMTTAAGQQTITPQMVRKFAKTARERMRIAGGGYRREHLRALAQRVEVADGEVRIMGSKGDLLRTLAAGSGAKSATPGVRSSVLRWRSRRDSNPR